MKITCPTCNANYNIPNHDIWGGKKASAKCTTCGVLIIVEVKVEKTKREHPRAKTENLLSYIGVDDHGNEKEHGMGKALDISMGGILLETLSPIISKNIVLTATDIKGELIDIVGKVTYQISQDSGMFRTGIQFVEEEDKKKSFIINMIKTYSKQYNRLATQ